MGPTLAARIARSLKLADSPYGAYAVSRFSDPDVRRRLEDQGVQTIAADLLNPEDWARLPSCNSVLYLVGSKFGTGRSPAQTWATNTWLPGRVLEKFPGSRITVLSTGNVYPLVSPESGGCRENHPTDPVGEYAQSCLGRERISEYFSLRNDTPVCILRLNYAVEARYGVLLDIAQKIWEEKPVALEMGYANVIWQGDANSIVFRSLELCQSPPFVLNLTGAEVLSIRELSEQFGVRLDRQPKFEGQESSTALLSDARRCREIFGTPKMPVPEIMDLVADWVRHGRPTFHKPTAFEVRDGRF